MDTKRIIHLADLHLGARPYGFREREEDILESFDNVVDMILEERPDIVVIAGDLFDKPRPDNQVLRRAIRGLRRVTSQGIPVVAAHGEHDTPGRRDNTVLQVVEAAVDGFHAPLPRGARSPGEVVESQRVRVGGVTVYVYPFSKVDLERRRTLAGKLLPAFSRAAGSEGGVRVFLGHFSLDTVFPLDSIASPGDLPRVDYAAMGHVHRRHIEYGDPVYAYPGSLEPLNVDEARLSHARGPLIVDIDPGGVRVEEVRLEVRRHLEVEAEARSPQEALNAISQAASQASRQGGPKPPLLYLKLRIPQGVPLRPLYQRAAEVTRRTGVLVKLSIERVKEGGARVIVAPETLDPVEVLAGELGVPREAARLVMELKEALLEDDQDRAVEVLDRLSRYPGILERWAR